MSKKILSELGGFTPVIDSVREEVGLIPAVVFGRMWLFCQMEDGVCKASLQTIADYTGLDKSTVLRHAQKLVKTGYLKDLTPDLRNKPHVYADTGKVALRLSLTTVAHSNAEPKSVAQNNASVAQNNASVAENQLNRISNRESNRGSAPVTELSQEAKDQAHAKVLAILGASDAGKALAHRRDIPDTLWCYADIYHELTGQKPRNKTVLRDWIFTFSDWQGAGLTVEHIRQAYKDIAGWSQVVRPGRLTETAVAIKARAGVPAAITKKLDEDFTPGVPNPYRRVL